MIVINKYVFQSERLGFRNWLTADIKFMTEKPPCRAWFLEQNKGKFPAIRRKQFDNLNDEEIDRMEKAFGEIFDIEG